MRDSNSFQATQLFDRLDGLPIQQADTIPEDISLARLHQQRALADSERRSRTYAFESRFVLFHRITKTIRVQLSLCCPLLSFVAHVLALIEANWALLWLRLALRKLSTTGCTNPMFHVSRSFSLYLNTRSFLDPTI